MTLRQGTVQGKPKGRKVRETHKSCSVAVIHKLNYKKTKLNYKKNSTQLFKKTQLNYEILKFEKMVGKTALHLTKTYVCQITAP